ncbi:MAG: serine hydrolase [Chloroflexota bacterium]
MAIPLALLLAQATHLVSESRALQAPSAVGARHGSGGGADGKPVRRSRTMHAHDKRSPARTVRLTAANTVLRYPAPPIEARAAFLIDMSSRQVLYQKNANEQLPMASTTKIMTAALTLAHARLTDMVTVSRRAASIGQSTMELRTGERLSVRDLLYGLLLNSGNDAAIALAQHVGGSVSHFVAMMNALARSLGMRHTHYATPHGLDAPHHYTSARDLATIALYAMRDPTFRRIVDTESWHIPATRHNREHWLGNINRIMYWFPGVDGVKPGDTDDAGLCQVVSVWRNGRHLLAVLLHTPTLWIDMRNLINFGARDFRWVQAPVWSDGPSDEISGGDQHRRWTYYFGSGRYVMGAFLYYFRTHGGLQTLGYPRTGVLRLGSQTVQFFQGAELIAGRNGSVYPEALGSIAAKRLARRALWPGGHPTPGFAGYYRKYGGKGVLGNAVSGTTRINGLTVQFFQYGALMEVGGFPHLLALGDAWLQARGLLPATGAGNSYPASLTPMP